MGKKKKIKKSKTRKVLDILNEWKEVMAIIIGVGSIIYAITIYKVNLEYSIKDKITEEDARTLIQIENAELKGDVRDIRNYLMGAK